MPENADRVQTASMPLYELLVGWLLGVLLGFRHAFEPDHLAAIATLVAEAGSPRRGALLGAFWGIGHSVSLFAVGGLLVVLHAAMPDRLGEAFEFAVAVMLVVLGARAVVRAIREDRSEPQRDHAHGRRVHRHGGSVPHLHLGSWTLARRPLMVGLVHGLAGSGALAALVT